MKSSVLKSLKSSLSRAPASAPRKEGKVEGSQLRLYKAKEGSRKHEAIACLNILGSPT
jgi:hypothetical protein